MILEDPDFGEIIISQNPRARNISMRPKEDGLHVTVPPYVELPRIMEAINGCRERLAKACQQMRPNVIDENYVIDRPLFKLRVRKKPRGAIAYEWDDGWFTLLCPLAIDFSNQEVQGLLRRVIEIIMKKAAKVRLGLMLVELSQKVGIPYKNLTITGARTRWGSCSSQHNISLSCYLVLQDTDLVEYVILHELCHVREMNHSDRFWALLNSMTDGKAFELRERLKKGRMVL